MVALDGNPVPHAATVPMLRLAPAERVCALVEMNNPGVWVLGEVRKHIQALGMGIVVEYAGSAGKPEWEQPSRSIGTMNSLRRRASAPAGGTPATNMPLVFESKFGGHGAMEAWTINGKSYPDAGTVALQQGRRYRLQFINQSMDDHPLHLHRHSFELRSLPGGTARSRGIIKDVVLVRRRPRSRSSSPPTIPAPRCFTAISKTTWTWVHDALSLCLKLLDRDEERRVRDAIRCAPILMAFGLFGVVPLHAQGNYEIQVYGARDRRAEDD